SMLARACGLAPDPVDDPARLIGRAQRTVERQPAVAAHHHALGLARLRAGQDEQAEAEFQASIRLGEDSPRNWYALALAYDRGGRRDEAARGYQKAERWMDQTESEFADRTTHRTPPVYITDWLEALVLRREIKPLLGRERLGDVVLVDRTVPAGRVLRL